MLNVPVASTGVCGSLGAVGEALWESAFFISVEVICFRSVVQNLGKFFFREMIGVWLGFGFAGYRYGFFLLNLVKCCHSLWFIFRNGLDSAGVAVGLLSSSFVIWVSCSSSRCLRKASLIVSMHCLTLPCSKSFSFENFWLFIWMYDGGRLVLMRRRVTEMVFSSSANLFLSFFTCCLLLWVVCSLVLVCAMGKALSK